MPVGQEKPLLGERWHRVAMTERGKGTESARPLSVALTGASSPQGEPFNKQIAKLLPKGSLSISKLLSEVVNLF